MTQDELAAKYHWRIKYPKTYEMAVRNQFLTGELPSEEIALEIVLQPEKSCAIDLKIARHRRELNNLRAAADALADLSVAERTKQRRRVRNRHTEWRGAPDIGVLLEQITDRLTLIESVLDLVP